MDIISIYLVSMNREIQQRLTWIKLYEDTHAALNTLSIAGLTR